MQRSRLTRREALGYGLRLLAAAGPAVLLATACSQPQAPAKPAEPAKPAGKAKGEPAKGKAKSKSQSKAPLVGSRLRIVG